MIPITHLRETDSTNRWLREHGGEEDMAVYADHQTAGRGCGNNTWESEDGKNLLFSVLCHPNALPVQKQYMLLEAMSLAIIDVLGANASVGTNVSERLNSGIGANASERLNSGIATVGAVASHFSIKWPNDIYYGDKKMAGTLTECRLKGSIIKDCILGTGINLNQTTFLSDAPNPISLCQVSGHEHRPEPLLHNILNGFYSRLAVLDSGDYSAIRNEYLSRLYRREGLFPYRDASGTFLATLETVEDDGRLHLSDAEGRKRTYLFKEVQHVLQ